MRTAVVRALDLPIMQIDATVNVNGRAQVEVHFCDGWSDDWRLTAAEAERLSRALAKAAEVARAKVDFACRESKDGLK